MRWPRTAPSLYRCWGRSLPAAWGTPWGLRAFRHSPCSSLAAVPAPQCPPSPLFFSPAVGPLRLVLCGGGSPVGTAMLTVFPVARHLWPFISVPNFRPLLCRAVSVPRARCPFPLEPLPALWSVLGPHAAQRLPLPSPPSRGSLQGCLSFPLELCPISPPHCGVCTVSVGAATSHLSLAQLVPPRVQGQVPRLGRAGGTGPWGPPRGGSACSHLGMGLARCPPGPGPLLGLWGAGRGAACAAVQSVTSTPALSPAAGGLFLLRNVPSPRILAGCRACVTHERPRPGPACSKYSTTARGCVWDPFLLLGLPPGSHCSLRWWHWGGLCSSCPTARAPPAPCPLPPVPSAPCPPAMGCWQGGEEMSPPIPPRARHPQPRSHCCPASPCPLPAAGTVRSASF